MVTSLGPPDHTRTASVSVDRSSRDPASAMWPMRSGSPTQSDPVRAAPYFDATFAVMIAMLRGLWSSFDAQMSQNISAYPDGTTPDSSEHSRDRGQHEFLERFVGNVQRLLGSRRIYSKVSLRLRRNHRRALCSGFLATAVFIARA